MHMRPTAPLPRRVWRRSQAFLRCPSHDRAGRPQGEQEPRHLSLPADAEAVIGFMKFLFWFQSLPQFTVGLAQARALPCVPITMCSHYHVFPYVPGFPSKDCFGLAGMVIWYRCSIFACQGSAMGSGIALLCVCPAPSEPCRVPSP